MKQKIQKDIQLRPYRAVEEPRAMAMQIRDWGHRRMKATAVYDRTKGERAIVFIVDTGQPDHEDLQSRKFQDLARNFTDSPTIVDLQGHATHCAGIACADDNDVGVIGVAPAAELVGIKTLDDDGSGASVWWHKALYYIADLDVPKDYRKVISMSFGSPRFSKQGEQAINYAISKNCFMVAAAGNSGAQEGDTVNYPGGYPNVLTVASMNKTGGRSWFSSRGAAVDLIAPGHSIYSCGLGNTYVRLSGTSMACPAIAGAVALLVSAFPQINTQFELLEIITQAAMDWGNRGKDVDSGHGEIFLDALFAAADARYPSAPTEPEEPPADGRRQWNIVYEVTYTNGKKELNNLPHIGKDMPSEKFARKIVDYFLQGLLRHDKSGLKVMRINVLSVQEVPHDYFTRPAPPNLEYDTH